MQKRCIRLLEKQHILRICSTWILYDKAVSCDVKDRKKAVLMAQLISTGYASTDEIHQMFVPGREGKVFDVMIDSCGAFCGIMVSLITQKFIEKKKGNQI